MKVATFVSLGLCLLLGATAKAQNTPESHPPPQSQPQPAPETTNIVPVAPITVNNAEMSSSARASKLIGSSIHKGDDTIGTIEDVMVDLDHSNVTAVIISVGGFLGIGEKRIAVPVNDIKIDKEAKFTTNLTKEQISKAPSFDYQKVPK